jgi:hypothetical protein
MLRLPLDGPELGRETGFPCLAVLGAEPLAAGRLCFAAPLRDIHVKHRLREPIAMSRALHFSGYRFLRWRKEKWVLVFRETDAVRREYGLAFESLLSFFNSLQQCSDSHASVPPAC